ncbi:MAG: hypothetical protein ACP5T3_03435 [Candidatus Micrarchaeia archaeon]
MPVAEAKIDAKKVLDELVYALKEPKQYALGENVECKITQKTKKTKGFDDDIEDVLLTKYAFYETVNSQKKLIEIDLEEHSHIGNIARIGINADLKDALRHTPSFSLPESYSDVEYYWLGNPLKKIFRKRLA